MADLQASSERMTESHEMTMNTSKNSDNHLLLPFLCEFLDHATVLFDFRYTEHYTVSRTFFEPNTIRLYIGIRSR